MRSLRNVKRNMKIKLCYVNDSTGVHESLFYGNCMGFNTMLKNIPNAKLSCQKEIKHLVFILKSSVVWELCFLAF